MGAFTSVYPPALSGAPRSSAWHEQRTARAAHSMARRAWECVRPSEACEHVHKHARCEHTRLCLPSTCEDYGCKVRASGLLLCVVDGSHYAPKASVLQADKELCCCRPGEGARSRAPQTDHVLWCLPAAGVSSQGQLPQVQQQQQQQAEPWRLPVLSALAARPAPVVPPPPPLPPRQPVPLPPVRACVSARV